MSNEWLGDATPLESREVLEPSPLAGTPFDSIVEQAVAGIYVLQDEVFVYVNHTWAAMLGYTVEEMTGMTLQEMVPAYFVGEVQRLLRLRLEGNPPSLRFITRGMHKAGHEVRIEVHGSRIVYKGRLAVMGVGVDVTQRLLNEEALIQSRRQLQDLAAYTHQKLEEQRAKFARDIHDLLGGMLTSIKMDAARILRRAQTEELRQLTQGLMDLTQQTLNTVKEISADLHPSDLEHLDLGMVIERDLIKFKERFGLGYTLMAAPLPQDLTRLQVNQIYRIFQECLTNVARHAKATEVCVDVATDPERFRIRIRDNGIGFDLPKVCRSALGLLSMKERARSVGAEFQVDSQVGMGTRVEISLRLAQP